MPRAGSDRVLGGDKDADDPQTTSPIVCEPSSISFRQLKKSTIRAEAHAGLRDRTHPIFW
jgi:hypothetical protein